MAETAQDSTVPLRGGDDKLKDEDMDDAEYSPFYGIEKGAVLQEARIFHQSNLDPRKCQQVITKLLYLQHQGEPFTQKEQLDVFLSVTKLFSNSDMNLRRMMYLCMRELCPDAPEVMIVINSLTKDMNAPQELYRANAIRVLRKMLDPSMLQQIERYFKQCIVDKSPVVAASALVAGLHMFGANAEVVKRWTSEIQQAVQSKHAMVQYHAIALQTAVRSGDRLAISKILSSLTAGSVRSPMAQCLVIKYIARVLAGTAAPGGGEKRPFYDFLLTSLRDRSDMVTFQAARTICELKDVTVAELSPAISALQLYLSSGKGILRFAAVRILNAVSMTQPVAVANCNNELETLITDTNRSIAVYAITTLLKTGSEASVDRVLKQMRTLMADIPDDFKVVVVDAIRALCLKFPSKNRALLNFLAHMLREEGGYEFKRAIVDALLVLMHTIPEVREAALLHLAEFIEDCEFTQLATQVLHLLGELAPETSDPARFVRFIYNRIVLENATVRAAATAALASICARCEPLRDRIVTILKRSLADNDDEVRDRCTLYLAHLERTAGGPDLVKARLDVPLANLERDLHAYLAGDMDADFDLSAVDRHVAEDAAPPPKKGKRAKVEEPPPPAATDADTEELGKELDALPQFNSLGPRFKTCRPVMLTEEGLEYVVHCVKHIFAEHVVLQFNCTNTFKEQVLEDVTMEVDLADLEEFEPCPELTVPLARMPHTSAGSTYVALKRDADSLAAGSAVVVMKFLQKARDPSSGEVEDEGYEEDYELEQALEISAADYIKPVVARNFKATWDELDADSEVSGAYALGADVGSVASAVESMISHMGMYVAEGTDLVVPNARSHVLMLSGELCGGHKALLRVSFGLDAKGGVAIKVVTRADDHDISEVVDQIVQSM